MIKLTAILAIATSILAATLPAKAEPVYLQLAEGSCSGTYVGNGYVLTAAHCTDCLLYTSRCV